MKFTTTAIFAILSTASTSESLAFLSLRGLSDVELLVVSAYAPVHARDVGSSKRSEVLKREAYAAAYAEAFNDILETHNVVARDSAGAEADQLVRYIIFPTVSRPLTITDYKRSSFDTRAPDDDVDNISSALETRGSNDKVILDYLRNIDTRTATGSFNKDVWTRIHGDTKSSVGGNLHIETGIMQGQISARLIQSGVKGSGAVLATVNPKRAQVGCAVHTLRVKYGGPNPPKSPCA